jgi:L-histidine N-alpha-methyltransferase
MSTEDTADTDIRLLDLHPPIDDFSKDVLQGLTAREKILSPKYFYDLRGSRLFDRITELPEYYPTRTELAIMANVMPEISEQVGPQASVIEFGSGSGLKTRKLLAGLEDPVSYVPVEISCDHLMAAARLIAAEYPDIEVLPVCADFTQPFDLPDPERMPLRNLVYFPGSTIGNFAQDEALQLLRVMHTEARPGGALLIGVDLRKDSEILERAYNDSDGVTAEFNLNLLRRINRELGADFDLGSFEHKAVWNDSASRIEMNLISRRDQTVNISDTTIRFAVGESILTEYSHKYDEATFGEMADAAGFAIGSVWKDSEGLFSIQLLLRAV